jgi:hypothetical protein
MFIRLNAATRRPFKEFLLNSVLGSFTKFFPCIQMLVKVGQCHALYVKAFCFASSVKSSFSKSECKHVIEVHSLQLGTQRSRATLQRLTPNVTCGALLQKCWLSPSEPSSKSASFLKYLNKRSRFVFIGVFAKLRKATISFVMSVCCLSNRMEQLGSHSTHFHEIWFWLFFENMSRKSEWWVLYTKTNIHFWYLARFFFLFSFLQTKVLEKIDTHCYVQYF